ncbi:hypothetical protein [Variovorax arabinosiphilus]|uniref:hypothetical protein n=1 Tax=Variovorax arabinosiphilus TaxID=3053498 RepID=UPI002575B242|nr:MULTISPECIES: hypothetical protein [unclassified Variovorax]MDM0122591.1 hypothetical protein [Variovorax sp. J2L1-78]MDM0130880.1 hypothetical protein [Variovorax sp. J2L1-63]MDM0235354.1 hypothetical protein [Variovorax sp. J2R1-6]
MFVLAVLAVLIVLSVLLYRRRHAGKPQGGLHLQALGITLAWIGGVLAFAMDRVELGAKAVFVGFAIGLVGLFVQTRSKGD